MKTTIKEVIDGLKTFDPNTEIDVDGDHIGDCLTLELVMAIDVARATQRKIAIEPTTGDIVDWWLNV